MAEKKEKKTESQSKTASSKQKKSTPSKGKSAIKSTSKPKTTTKATKAAKTTLPEAKTFSSRSLNKQSTPATTPEKKVPAWIVIIFIFSLVFFLFSLYKIFIYGEGYSAPEPINLLPISTTWESWSLQEEDQTGTLSSSQGLAPESDLTDWELMLQDTQLIQDFYSYLTNNQIEEMNALVDRPLKNSITWANHWNKKNIKIFTKHLSDTVLLQEVFLIPNSINKEKQTRQYSYTLHYTIEPEQSFTEQWQLTLLTREGKTLISEIMCKTEGCSRSPFFWPQNYGLK